MTPTNYNPATWDWSYLLGQTVTILLEIVGAAIIFVVGWLLASLVTKLFDKLLLRLGFDRLIERGGIKQALDGTGYSASRLLSKFIFFTLMIFVTAFALNVFGPNPISGIFSRFIAFFPNILVAIAIVVFAAAIGSFVRDLIRGAIGGLSYGRTISTVAYVGILLLGAFMALTQLNIATPIIVGLWYAMLALAVGVGIVAIGGGGIKPMEERWRRTLDRADDEIPRVMNQMQGHGQLMDQRNPQQGFVPGQGYAQPGYGQQPYPQQGINYPPQQPYPNQPGVVYPQNMPNPNDPNYRP